MDCAISMAIHVDTLQIQINIFLNQHHYQFSLLWWTVHNFFFFFSALDIRTSEFCADYEFSTKRLIRGCVRNFLCFLFVVICQCI